MPDIYDQLTAEFPRDMISWRAQSVTKEGDKALALAYIDARDVMERLDAVVGPENWSDRYEVHGTKTICYLSVRSPEFVNKETGEVVPQGEWVTKADGAGDTDVEAEKGAISDAFKRSAVKWGIGRYLYEIKSPWVPCESNNKDGRNYWKKWTADPWDFVKTTAKAPRTPAGGIQPALPVSAAKPHWTVIVDAMRACSTVVQLNGEWSRHEPVFMLMPDHYQDELKQEYLSRREAIQVKDGAELAKAEKAAKLANTP